MRSRIAAIPSKVRLAAILAVILCLSIVSISLINYRVAREAVRREALESSLPLTRDTIYSEVHGAMMEPIFVSSLMAHDTFLKDWSLAGEGDAFAVTKYLTEIKNRYGCFSSFFVSARTGNYYHFDGVLKRISRDDAHDVWFYRFIDSDMDYELTVDTDEASSDALTIFINFRMRDYGGELLGVAGVGIRMSLVAELLRETQAKYGKRIYLADRSGAIQVYADRMSIERRSLWDMEGIKNVARLILDDRMPAANYEYDAEGRHILLTSRYVPELTWFLLVEEDETAALATARASLVRTLAIGFAMSLLVIAVCLYTVNCYQKRLENQATRDELTGLINRREFQRQFAVAAYLSQRRKCQASVILLDVDGFKAVNDLCGHQTGDKILVAVAALAKSAIRPNDCLARWGGDEFIAVVMLPLDKAMSVAERIRLLVAEADLAGRDAQSSDPRRAVSVSCGVAAVLPGDDLDSVIHRADQALYRSKQEGRDRVSAA